MNYLLWSPIVTCDDEQHSKWIVAVLIDKSFSATVAPLPFLFLIEIPQKRRWRA